MKLVLVFACLLAVVVARSYYDDSYYNDRYDDDYDRDYRYRSYHQPRYGYSRHYGYSQHYPGYSRGQGYSRHYGYSIHYPSGHGYRD